MLAGHVITAELAHPISELKPLSATKFGNFGVYSGLLADTRTW